MPDFEAHVLGGFELRREGGDVKALHTERLLLFLSYLFVHYDSTPSRKQISFLFWADSTEEQARTNLRNILHYLRKALPELDSILEVDHQFIRLRSDADLSLDIRSFKSALASAKSSKNEMERIQYLQEAVSHYRGELLPGFYDDWVLAAREECHQAYLDALFELSNLLEDAPQYTEAIRVVNRLLRADVLNESAYQKLMRLHALNDDRAGALQVYHTCSTVLMRELGVEPSADIKRLHEQLTRSGELLNGEGGANQIREANRLIGRKQEWGRLREAWSSIQKGRAGMFVISGEAGIGKSRLSSELMQWTKRQGIVTAFAQCYPMEENLSFAPVVAWLRTPEIQAELGMLAPLWKNELARLMPEMETRTAEAGEKKWQKQRLFEAVAKGLLGSGKPRLLVLDDAQWSDRETLEFVQYLMRYAAGSPLMLLATARVEELDANHSLQRLRAALQARKQFHELELNPLDRMEVGLLAREIMGGELSDARQDELFAETEGNPFFVVETLRNNEAGVVPQNLRTVLNQRLSQLSALARELVGVASVIGREFGYALLARSSQMDENQLVRALDELWARRIFQTRGDGGYAFGHGKLLDAAYESLPQPRKQLFHQRIAEALLNVTQVEDAIVARHFELAGDHQKAFEAYLKAASSARRVFANRDAISHLEKALGLLKGKIGLNTEEQKAQAAKSWETLGDLYDFSSNAKKSLEAYDEALIYIPQEDTLERARVLGKFSKVAAYAGDYLLGQKYYLQALDTMGEERAESGKTWWNTWFKLHLDWAWIEYDIDNLKELQEVFGMMHPKIEQIEDADLLAEYYFLLPTMIFRRDGYLVDGSILQYTKFSLELSLKGRNLELQSWSNFGYGFTNYLLDDFETALKYLHEGLRLAEQIGHVERQAFCLTYITGANRRAGNLEECRKYAEISLALCEREGYGTFMSTAIANLGWLAWKKGDLCLAKELSQKAAKGWSKYYPFWWYGLWTLIDISLSFLNVDEAVQYVHQLKSPGQQVFPQEVDSLLIGIIQAAEQGDKETSKSLLLQAVSWAKEHHFL